MKEYRLESKNILVIGDVMLDKNIIGSVNRVSPEAPVPVVKTAEEKDVLGGAANVALNVAKAEQNTYICSVIGDDEAGIKILELLENNNIDTSGITKDSQRVSTVKTRIIAQNNQQLLRIDTEEKKEIGKGDEKVLIEKIGEIIKTIDVVILSDYEKGVLTDSFCKEIINLANANNKKVIVDVKGHNPIKYANAFLIKPNKKELHDLTGIELNNEDDILHAAKKLKELTNAENVLVTLGGDGMLLLDGNSSYRLNEVGREIYDVTGAGDTVIAYLAAGIADGMSTFESMQLASRAANIKVSKKATYAVPLEEINQSMDESKVISLDEIETCLEPLRDKKIVFTNGCFDILHYGHVKYLKEASKLGDILVVGLNSDSSIKRLKGEERPIVKERERAAVLAAIGSIDYVVLFEEDTPINLIKKVKPDVLVKGGDYKADEIVGADFVQEHGGEVITVQLYEGHSTTNIVNLMKG